MIVSVEAGSESGLAEARATEVDRAAAVTRGAAGIAPNESAENATGNCNGGACGSAYRPTTRPAAKAVAAAIETVKTRGFTVGN